MECLLTFGWSCLLGILVSFSGWASHWCPAGAGELRPSFCSLCSESSLCSCSGVLSDKQMYLPTVQELFPPYTCDCVHLGSKDLLPCSRENDCISLTNFASSPSDFVKALCFLSVCCFLIPWLVLFLNNSMSFVPAFDIRCETLNNPSSALVIKICHFHTRKHYFATVLRKENDKTKQRSFCTQEHIASSEMSLNPSVTPSRLLFCVLLPLLSPEWNKQLAGFQKTCVLTCALPTNLVWPWESLLTSLGLSLIYL